MIIIDKHTNKLSWKHWKWLFSLLSYDTADMRAFVNHVTVEDGMVNSTDGHRMHCLALADLPEPMPIEPGQYRVAYTKSEFILLPVSAKMPDFRSVWPKHGNGERSLTLDGPLSKFLAVFNSESENLYNVDFIQDALGVKRAGANLVHAEVFFYGPLAPVALAYEPRMALIMPMRV